MDGRTTDIDCRLVVIALLSMPLFLVLLVIRLNSRWNPVEVFFQVTLAAFAATCLSEHKVRCNRVLMIAGAADCVLRLVNCL